MLINQFQTLNSWYMGAFHSYQNVYGRVPIVSQQKQIWLASMRIQVQSKALLSGLRISIAVSCSAAHRRGLDLALLWWRSVATAPIWSLGWEPPYAKGTALKKKKSIWLNTVTKIIHLWLNSVIKIIHSYWDDYLTLIPNSDKFFLREILHLCDFFLDNDINHHDYRHAPTLINKHVSLNMENE